MTDQNEIIVTFYTQNSDGKLSQILGSDGTIFTRLKTERGVRMKLWKNKKFLPAFQRASFASFSRRFEWERGNKGVPQPMYLLGWTGE